MLDKASPAGVLALAIALALVPACGGSRARGPAWPEPHAREADGGESLAPRQKGAVAAIEAAADAPSSVADPDAPAELDAGAEEPSLAPATRPDLPAADAPADDELEILEAEELVIEIED